MRDLPLRRDQISGRPDEPGRLGYTSQRAYKDADLILEGMERAARREGQPFTVRDTPEPLTMSASRLRPWSA